MRKRILLLTVIIGLPVMAAAQTTPAPEPPAAPAATTAAPATSSSIPEPGDFALFLIGVAGLIVGRWTARSRNRNPE